MKSLLRMAAGVFLTLILIATANAGSNGTPAEPQGEAPAQQAGQEGKSVTATPDKAATSVVDRYQKRQEIKKRAAEMRKSVIKQELQKEKSGNQDQQQSQ